MQRPAHQASESVALNPPLLLQTKLQLPAIPPRALFCDRIKRLSLEECRLALLVAPAGFGKTTAILLSLQRHRERTRWYRLEREDSFLPVFYGHLLSMLFPGQNRFQSDSFRMFSSLGNLQEDYPLLNAQICQDMAGLCGESAHDLFLVFDDYQAVMENDTIRLTMQYFASNMPECVHMIIASRKDPGILTGKLSLHPRCHLFDATNLLFQRHEIRSLVQDVYGMQLDDDQFEYLVRVSEGWAAGICLICHARDRSLEYPPLGTPSENVDALFFGFLQEFLASVTDSQKALLLELSQLDDFSLDELSNLFQRSDASAFLHWIEQSDLYLQRIAGNPLRYRFHSLFRDGLSRLYRQSTDPQAQRALQRRIADYYRGRDLTKSVFHYLEAGREESAFDLVADRIKDAFAKGEPEACFSLLGLFSEEQLKRSPYLMFVEAMQLMNTDRATAEANLLHAMDEFGKRGDYAFLMNCFGMIMVIAFQTNDFSVLQGAAKRLPVLSIVLRSRAGRTDLIISKFISLTGQDDLVGAKRYNRYLEHRRIDDVMWQFSYLMIRGIFHYRCGNLEESRKNLERILAHPIMSANDQWRIIGLVSCCNVSFFCAKQDLMQFFVNEFLLLGEKYGSPFSLGYAFYVLGFQKYLQGNTPGALDAFRRAREQFALYGSDVLVQEVVSLLCLIGETDPTESLLAEAQEAAAFFARENPGHGMMEFSHAVVGAIHKKRGEYAQAERIFAECLALCSKKRARQSAYGIYLHLCDLYFLMGDEESGRRYLDLWANLGKERGYVYSTTMDFSTLHRVLKRAESEHLHGTYCRLLNSYHEKNRAVREDDTVSVRLFGPFQLIYRNMTLAESDFKTKKVCGILKYVLARRTVQSRERLAALFWPDADRKSSQTSLRVALYELRKTLAKVGLPFESDTALLEETKEGMRLKEGAAVEIDVHEFDRLFRQWEESATDDVQALIELCSLYRGPFLGESECDDWATIRREHYASMYAEAVHTLGHKALEGTSAPAIQEQLVRSLEMNPLDEECAATLIALYCKEGQQARAKSFYRRFKQRFRAEMGVEARLSL
ncbi:MAG: BTAD domain-containing putative transcriptional regulator [Acidobacteriota bacterium]|nr:BTAD domain-containing putative transcriptional regulator [Acidobacteriota bacterium]